MSRRKPLTGLKVVEFAGLAPAPFAGMVLADFGAEPNSGPSLDILARGKRSICVSAKSSAGRSILRKLIATADVLIDPFRPGVLEKLGLGPAEVQKLNPRLVYARMYGFERDSRYADMAGHDIGYAGLSGVLSLIRPQGQKPIVPLNILADFAGGGIICAFGILLALLERHASGRGQVVNTDMVTGLRYIASFPLLLQASKKLMGQQADLLVLDGTSPYYTVYQTKDGKYFTVGALENRFYAIFLQTLRDVLRDKTPRDSAGRLLLDRLPRAEDQYEKSTWPTLRAFFTEVFLSQTRDEWEQAFMNTDSCCAPVVDPEEVAQAKGSPIPRPAPHLERTPGMSAGNKLQQQFLKPGKDTLGVLQDLGMSASDITRLQESGEVECNDEGSSKAKL